MNLLFRENIHVFFLVHIRHCLISNDHIQILDRRKQSDIKTVVVVVVVVYHVSIVAIGNGLLKKFWPFW